MKTKGSRNPDWSREETILALDLFHELDGKAPSASDERVEELSRLLRSNPVLRGQPIATSFRNTASIVFKLGNLAAARGGSGFANNSQQDREIWMELGEDRVRTARLASAIRSTFDDVEAAEVICPDADEGIVFAEGELVTRVHRIRERSPRLRSAVLKARKGQLQCDACGTDAKRVPESIRSAMFEAHHIVPLAVSGRRTVRVSDCVLLCASCHRLVHAAIALNGEWLDRDAISRLIKDVPEDCKELP